MIYAAFCPTPIAILLGIIYILVGNYRDNKRREEIERENAIHWAEWEKYMKDSDEKFELEMAEKKRLKRKEQAAKNVLWFVCDAEKRIHKRR